jgi:hypothetical protein
MGTDTGAAVWLGGDAAAKVANQPPPTQTEPIVGGASGTGSSGGWHFLAGNALFCG